MKWWWKLHDSGKEWIDDGENFYHYGVFKKKYNQPFKGSIIFITVFNFLFLIKIA